MVTPKEHERPGGSARFPGASFPVVALGASAGGLDVYERFFDRMPSDTGAAFVVVQHLSPDHVSVLAEILGNHSGMSVMQIEDDVRVEPNRVYLIPPNKGLTFTAGRLRLTEASSAPRVPIDGFLVSLAVECRERAVGIILSGAGSDGAAGIASIKHHGGTTMAQAPESARFDSMPRSAIATGCVDDVLPVEEMPARLMEHLARLSTRSDFTRSGAIAAACAIVKQRTGHDFSRYKEATVGRRIVRRMHLVDAGSVEAYLDRLHEDPREAELLVKDLLINVTQFFRDPEVFDFLGKEVLPKLFQGKGERDSVRVWVPGCASGEEAYTIAILLSEHMSTLAAPPEVKLFATDIDDEALEEARQGRYSMASLAAVSPARRERFFNRPEEDGEGAVVRKALRDLCIFAKHNLVSNPPFSRLDLVSCRNTLIYLRSDLQDDVLAVLHYALRPGGHLLLAPAESPAARAELFNPVSERHRVFRRREVVTPVSIHFPLEEPLLTAEPQQPRAPDKVRRAARAIERVLLEKYVPASVAIDEQGAIVYLAGPTGRYLEQSPGAPAVNLVDLVRRELRLDLRAAIQEAHETRREAVRADLAVTTEGGPHRVDLRVRPLLEISADANLLLVVFDDKTSAEPSAKPDTVASGIAVPAMAAQLQMELERTRVHLLATIDDRQVTNEQLQTANEELLSMNEEMASTNEEMQTSREEMQSVNEELQTLATELRHRIEQLDAANSDLRNIFESTHIATVFLDQEQRIKRFTPAIRELFNLVEGDIERPLSDIMPRFTGGDLTAVVGQVLRTLSPQEREVHRRDSDRWFAQRVQPYRTVDNLVDGVVVTFVDITDRKRAADALAAIDRRKNEFVTMLAHELRNPLVPIRNAVSLLGEVVGGGPEAKRARETIDRQVVHMVRMIDDLLDVSRVAQGKVRLEKKPLDLVALVRGAVEDVRSSMADRGLKLDLELPDGPLPMMADPTRLAQVIGNLLSNAQKFTDPGGRVRVALQLLLDRRRAVLVVEDNGIGMGADILPWVFDVFTQADRSLARSRGGLGLGLSLVKGLVAQHGGSVLAESAGAGRGSRFVVELPLEPEGTVLDLETSVATPSDGAAVGRRILVIEDNADVAATMQLLLQRWGHEVAVEREGEEAVEAAKQFRPDIVFCDIGLAGGMSGLDVARALRGDPGLRSVYLVALTGYGSAKDAVSSQEAGFDLHLTKPASAEELKRAVARAAAAR